MKIEPDNILFNIIIVLLYIIIQPYSCFPAALAGADTVKLNIAQAEKRFLQNNLQLLAYRYDINAAKASVIQAELWDNPNVTIGQNIYNKFTGKYFDFTKSGNTDIQIQQLILLAGKRNDQVNIAQLNTSTAENSFYDILRSLKFELRTDFSDLFFLQKTLRFYDESVPSVQKTVDASEKLFQGHSILLSEVLRLKSLLLTLENEKLNTLNRISDIENDLNVLLSDSTGQSHYFIPDLTLQQSDSLKIESISLNDAVTAAYDNRPDIKIAGLNLKSEEANLKLQKALAIPDITVGGSYSRNGSYIPDYLALTLSVDLPVFNRNQGNIEVSENNIEADKALFNKTMLTVKNEVAAAYEKAIDANRLYSNMDRDFSGEYSKLASGMIANYEGRNMTIIEFTDFYESYRSSVLQTLQIQNNMIDAFENLNYAVGKDLIHFAGN